MVNRCWDCACPASLPKDAGHARVFPPSRKESAIRYCRLVPMLWILLLLLVAVSTPAAQDEGDEGRQDAQRAIERLLTQQARAWNDGDFESFVAFYTEDTVFLSSSGLTRGRSEVLARYRRRYPDRAAMGKLTFEIVELRLSPDAQVGSVAARWHLHYPESGAREDASGLTLLVCHLTNDGWRIVQDASL